MNGGGVVVVIVGWVERVGDQGVGEMPWVGVAHAVSTGRKHMR